MPRKDGFPTNAELIKEFTHASRDLYISAFDQIIMDNLDYQPAFRDKPLNSVILVASRRAIDEVMINGGENLTDDYVAEERLSVAPIDEMLTTFREGPRGIGSIPRVHDSVDDDVFRDLAIYSELATVTEGLDAAQVIPSQGVGAFYTATTIGDKKLHMDNMQLHAKRPTKQRILSARTFAEEMYSEVNRPMSEEEYHRQLRINQALAIFGLEPTNDISFTLSRTPNIPLNGYEPKPWLDLYIDEMSQYALDEIGTIERTKDRVTVEVNDYRHAMVDKYSMAVKRAQAVIDGKNSSNS